MTASLIAACGEIRFEFLESDAAAAADTGIADAARDAEDGEERDSDVADSTVPDSGVVVPSWEPAWSVTFGGAGSDELNTLASDGVGGFLVGGLFQFDLTIGAHSIMGEPRADAFIAGIDSTGTPTWARAFGTEVGLQQVTSIAHDGDGGFYAAGIFQDDMLFDATPLLRSAGRFDLFLACFGPDRVAQWSMSFGGVQSDSRARISRDDGGDLLFAAQLGGSTSFLGEATTINGASDFVIARSDEAGVARWVRSYGAAAGERAYELVSSEGRFFATGIYANSTDLDAETFPVPVIGSTVFMAEIVAGDGSVRWALPIADVLNILIDRTVVAVGSNRVAAMGIATGEASILGTPVPSGSETAYIVVTDLDGVRVWHQFIDGVFWEQPQVGVDHEGFVYVALPVVADPIDFGDGPIPGPAGLLVVVYDRDGEPVWSRRFPTPDVRAEGMVIGPDRSCVIGGEWGDTIDFGDGIVTEVEAPESFVLRLEMTP